MRRREKQREKTTESTIPFSEVHSPDSTEDESSKWRQLSMSDASSDQDDVWKTLSVLDQSLPSRKERFSKPLKPKKSKDKRSFKNEQPLPSNTLPVEESEPVVEENETYLTSPEVVEPLEGISELIEEIEAQLAHAELESDGSSTEFGVEDSNGIDEIPIGIPLPTESKAQVELDEGITLTSDLQNESPKLMEQAVKKQKQPKQKRQLANKARGKLPLGMVFDGNTLIFTEIQPIKNGYRARKLVIQELPEIRFPIEEEKVNEFTNILREILKREHWKKRKVVMSAPAEFVMLRHITVPKMAKKVLDVAIKSEVENNVSFPFESPRYDYVLLEETCIAEPNEENQNVVIVAAPGIDLERYVNCTRQAGFFPIRIEPGILGIQRMIMNSGEKIEKKQLYVVLHLRFDGAEFGFFEGENLLFMRHMDQKPTDYHREDFQNFGQRDEQEEIPSKNDIKTPINALPGEVEDFDVESYSADLGYEIDRSLNFVHYNLIKNEATVPLLYLVNAMLDVEPVVTVLKERLEQEIRVVESHLLFERPDRENAEGETPWTVKSAHYAATALGLALPEVEVSE